MIDNTIQANQIFIGIEHNCLYSANKIELNSRFESFRIKLFKAFNMCNESI